MYKVVFFLEFDFEEEFSRDRREDEIWGWF